MADETAQQPRIDQPENALEDLAPREPDEAATQGGNTASSNTTGPKIPGKLEYPNLKVTT